MKLHYATTFESGEKFEDDIYVLAAGQFMQLAYLTLTAKHVDHFVELVEVRFRYNFEGEERTRCGGVPVKVALKGDLGKLEDSFTLFDFERRQREILSQIVSFVERSLANASAGHKGKCAELDVALATMRSEVVDDQKIKRMWEDTFRYLNR